ncbi:hypothetical protein GGI20_006144, partial [Coemansia sp. BCRC 34301]
MVLNAHPMAITDIAWAPLTPGWIGTVSIDPVVKIWDVRGGPKPVWYYSAWEPADKVAFNKVDSNLLATVHRNKIEVWDLRFGSSPRVTIPNAHADDISSISWHPRQQNILVSAGLDYTVKRWSIEHEHPTEEYRHVFDHDILSAKYLPFGEGILVTARSPQTTALVIRDNAHLSVEHQFIGHEDTILGSEWRLDGNRFQLITWGQDRTLRMWALDSQLVERIGGKVHWQTLSHGYEQTPSFASNLLGVDEVMHLLAKKQFPSDLLLEANNSAGGSHRFSTMHEFGRVGNALEGGAVLVGKALPEDHSSDDDEDDDGLPADHVAWFDEVAEVGNMYRESKSVSVKDVDRDRRQCRLSVGVPWLTRQTVNLRIGFPAEYPSAALDIVIETSGFSGGSELLSRMKGIADACAGQSIKAVHQCLHSLVQLLVSKVQPKRSHDRQDEYERRHLLPAPPQELM